MTSSQLQVVTLACLQKARSVNDGKWSHIWTTVCSVTQLSNFFQVLSSIPVRKYTHEIKLNAVTVNKWFNRNSVVLMRESTLIQGCSYRYFDLNSYGLYDVMIYTSMYVLYKCLRNIKLVTAMTIRKIMNKQGNTRHPCLPSKGY